MKVEGLLYTVGEDRERRPSPSREPCRAASDMNVCHVAVSTSTEGCDCDGHSRRTTESTGSGCRRGRCRQGPAEGPDEAPAAAVAGRAEDSRLCDAVADAAGRAWRRLHLGLDTARRPAAPRRHHATLQRRRRGLYSQLTSTTLRVV